MTYALKIMVMGRNGRDGPVAFRVHAVDGDGRAACRVKSARGWADTMDREVTCPHCRARLAIENLRSAGQLTDPVKCV